MGAAAALNVACCLLFDLQAWWAIGLVAIYNFGLALAMPAMSMQVLDIYPRMRGLAASLLNFVMMILFAIVSGFVVPVLFGSALKFGLGLAAFVGLAMVSWVIGSMAPRVVAEDAASPHSRAGGNPELPDPVRGHAQPESSGSPPARG
jgi:DHA1 family bicyclomycin/chloramphenicol resistance-like MFS transporter